VDAPEHALPHEIRNLVERCRSGCQAAMAELVEQFRGQVFGLCLRMLGNRQDAEDMAQEAFVRALRSLHRWDPRREFRPWLLSIAGNRCRTLLAKRQRQPRGVGDVEQLPDRRPSSEGYYLLAEEVEQALAGLRREYRQAFLLFHEQQLSYEEIAAALGCPVGTAKTWVHRARRELADILSQRGVLEEKADEVRRV
jgi:RNA polymerase sigma-70 factor (ECF subfamily)